MKTLYIKIKINLLLGMFILQFLTQNASAQVTKTATTGNWNTAATWTPVGVPASNDSIVIPAGVKLTANTTTNARAIAFTGLGGVFTVNPGITITVSNAITLYCYASNVNVSGTISGTGILNAGNLNIGIPSVVSTKGSDDTLTLNISTLNLTGDFTIYNNDQGGGKAVLPVVNINSPCSLSAGRIVLIQSGSGAGGSRLIKLNAATGSTVHLSNGPNPITVSSSVSLSSAHILFTLNSSTFDYNGSSAAQTIPFLLTNSGLGGNTSAIAINYGNLYTNNTSSGGATLGAAVTATNVTGDLRVQSGTLKNGGFAMAGNAGKNFQVANGAFFEMSGTAVFPTGFGTYTFGPTSTTRYLQTNAQNVSTQTYGHLEVKPAANSITHSFAGGITTVAGNLTVGNGTNTAAIITAATNATTLTVNGNVTINGNTTLIGNTANTFTVGGNWINHGIYTANSGNVTLNGTAQNIDGISVTTFYNLTINTSNSPDSISISTSPLVQNLLTMTRGNVFTGSNYLGLGISTINKGMLYYTSGYIVGKMRRWFNGTNINDTTGLYPLGQQLSGSLKKRFFKIAFNVAPVAGGYLDVSYINQKMLNDGLPINGINNTCLSGATFNVTNSSDQGYWSTTPQSATIGESGSYTLSLTGQDIAIITDLCQLTVLKRSVSSQWSAPGTHLTPSGSISMPTLSRTSLTGFSDFGFGGGDPNPLPVELVYFHATCAEGNGVITWATATEVNSKEFVLECSENGIDFSSLSVLAASGNSVETRNYSYIDQELGQVQRYYRLKMIDIDGSFSYSPMITTNCDGEIENTFTIYASAPQEITLQTQLSVADIYKIEVIDVLGRNAFSSIQKIDKGASNMIFRMDKSSSNRLCLIHISNNDGTLFISKKIWIP